MASFFRHCETETITPVEGTTFGIIPKWLEGTLIRNGPGIQKIRDDEYQHAFDGLAILQRIHIADGKAVYSSRALESEVYRKSMEAQRIVVSGFGTTAIPDPCARIFSSLKTEFEEGQPKNEEIVRDNCLVNVVYHGDHLYAMTETNYTKRISPESLLPIGETTRISDYIAINIASAHPHILPNGNIINSGFHFTSAKGPHYAFFEVPPKFNTPESCFADAKKIIEIPVRIKSAPSYFHSFGMTKDKVILVEAPLRIHLDRLLTKEGKKYNKCLKEALQWHTGEKTRFIVASMKTGEIHPIVYETDDLFVLHHVNAYEEDDHIIVDVAGYDSGSLVVDNFDKANIAKVYSDGESARRYVLPLNISKTKSGNLVTLKNTTATATVRQGDETIVDIKPHILLKQWFEFPKINYKLNGKKYRYMYGVTSSTSLETNKCFPDGNTLVKIDVETGKVISWTAENVITPEPIFVANPTIENPAEDDGVLISPLLHTDDLCKVTLLILDAKTFKEIGHVEFRTAGTATFTFHGQWANQGDRIHLY